MKLSILFRHLNPTVKLDLQIREVISEMSRMYGITKYFFESTNLLIFCESIFLSVVFLGFVCVCVCVCVYV